MPPSPHARVVAKEIAEVVGRGHRVKGRVHREEHHLYLGVLGDTSRDLGVVRGEADVVDDARRAQLAHVAHEGAVAQDNLLVLLHLVHVVDHVKVNVVGVEAREKVLEGRPHQVKVACTRALPINRDRPQMPLDSLLQHICSAGPPSRSRCSWCCGRSDSRASGSISPARPCSARCPRWACLRRRAPRRTGRTAHRKEKAARKMPNGTSEQICLCRILLMSFGLAARPRSSDDESQCTASHVSDI